MVEADAARRDKQAADAAETKARQASALLQGRVEELERLLLEHDDKLSSAAGALPDAARRESQLQISYRSLTSSPRRQVLYLMKKTLKRGEKTSTEDLLPGEARKGYLTAKEH